MSQTITAMFDSRSDAQAAMNKLTAAGIPMASIRLLPGNEVATQSTGVGYDHTVDAGGFWASLKDLFMPEEDRYTYAEGMSCGGTMLSVTAEDSKIDTAMDILEQHGSVDLDERETTWRKSGWNGYNASTSMAAASKSTTSMPKTAATGTGLNTTDKDYIPVMQEELRVGKRMTENGRVRVRSYVVETPVTEQVSLHSESVQIDRRPVDRAVTGNEALFVDKTIDAIARSEEVVVSKDVRVKEEIGIRKEAADRVETVSDKVRRTEVEVDDGKGNITRPTDPNFRK